jgi:putative endopeptidase
MDFIDHIDQMLFDPTTSVSEDFYRHVNGGWLDANPVPSEYPAWGSFFEVHVRNEAVLHEILLESADDPGEPGTASRMVGDYFAAGMDEGSIAEAGVDPLRPYLDQIEEVGSHEQLRECLAQLHRIGVGALHSVSIAPDFEDAGAYLTYLGQGGLGLPERDYYLRDDERSQSLIAAYESHVATQLANLGESDAPSLAHDIVELEKRLAEASYPAEKMRDVQLTLNRHDVDELDDLMPGFGLQTYARSLGVSGDTLSIDNPGFFTALETTLSEVPLETIRPYLRWHLIRRFASALPPAFEDTAFDFYGRTLGGQQEQRPRWTRVLAAASADIGEQVSRLFVERTFSPEAKRRCETMVDHLIEAMGRSIRDLDWMTPATKEAALVKVRSFGHKIGYPDEWRDNSGLEIGRSSFVDNRVAAAVFEHDREFGRLGEPVDEGEWAMPAHTVNAYYNPLLNEVVFPAGILQPPFFYDDADDAVVYGSIGAVIGHEITHGFDDRGSQFDENGKLRNWWSDADRAEFDQRAGVLADQFSGYEVGDGQKVNGRLTLGENIADLGGLAIAYDAFLTTMVEGSGPQIGGLDPLQRFFLAYATIWRMNYTDEYLTMLVNVDVHSPNPLRVNGVLANFPPFADVFDVDEGSPLRRSVDDLVKIW